MKFIYEFELCALIFLVILSVFYYSRKKLSIVKNKLFSIMLILCIVSTILDIITAIIQNNSFIINPIWNYLINIFYMLSQIALLIIFFFYLISLITKNKKTLFKKTLLMIIPSLLLAILIITTPFSKFIFFIEDGNYQFGVLHWLLYVVTCFYFILCILIIIKYYKLIEKIQIQAILFYIGIGFIIQLIQFFNPTYLLASLGTSLGIFLLFLALQSPNEYIDNNTNLFNNEAFYLILNEYFYKNKKFSLMIFSLENYKNINSLFGVDFGKSLLKETASYLKSIYQYNNIFYFNNSCFAIICDKDLSKQDLLLEYNNFPISFDIQSINLQALPSIIGLKSNDFSGIDEMYTIIEHCLKIVRESTDNIIFFNADDINKTKRRIKVINAINKAIKNNSIELLYQPIFDVKSKKIICAESLARLYDEEIGYIPPDEFIKIAERNDSIVKIGKIIFEKTCSFLSKLSSCGLKDFVISVNLSVAQCMELDLIKNIELITAKYGINSKQIIFEITESYDSNSISLLKSTMNELSKKGYMFALDDYGTRYSSLEYVINLPFNYVKIDKSLLLASENCKKNCSLFVSTIKAFQDMELSIICEGVENKKQYEFLENLSVVNIQGYYLSKPLSEEDLINYIADAKTH